MASAKSLIEQFCIPTTYINSEKMFRYDQIQTYIENELHELHSEKSVLVLWGYTKLVLVLRGYTKSVLHVHK